MKDKLQNTPAQNDIKEDVEDLVRDLLMSIEESIDPLLSRLNAMHSDLMNDDEDHILSVEVSRDAIYGHMETKNRQGEESKISDYITPDRHCGLGPQSRGADMGRWPSYWLQGSIHRVGQTPHAIPRIPHRHSSTPTPSFPRRRESITKMQLERLRI